MPILLECGYDETHEYPDDWTFGGADGCHPGADARWKPTTYRYLDRNLQQIWVTQTPLCDEQALDEFTLVSSFGDMDPVYLAVRRPGDKSWEVLPFEYRKSTDTVYPILQSSNG